LRRRTRQRSATDQPAGLPGECVVPIRGSKHRLAARVRQAVRSRLNEVLRGVGSALIGVIGARLLNLLGSVIIARTASLAQFGAFSLGYTFAMLVGQASAIFDTSFVRTYGVSRDRNERRALVRGQLYLKLAVAALLILVGLSAAGVLSVHVFGKAGLEALMFVSMADAAFFGLVATGAAFFQARRQFVRYSIVLLIEAAAGAAAVGAYAVATRPDALGGMLCYVVVDGTLAAAVSVLLYVRSRGPLPRSGVWHAMRRIVRFSGWLLPAQVVYIVQRRIDILVLAMFVSFRSLAYYGAAARLLAIASLLTGTLSGVFVAEASEAVGAGSSLRAYLAKARMASVLTVGVIVVVVILAPVAVGIILGPQYAPSVEPLRLLLVGQAFVAMALPSASLIIGLGRNGYVFVARVIELALAVGAALLLITRLGPSGAALAMLIASAGGALFTMIVAHHLVRRASTATRPRP